MRFLRFQFAEESAEKIKRMMKKIEFLSSSSAHDCSFLHIPAYAIRTVISKRMTKIKTWIRVHQINSILIRLEFKLFDDVIIILTLLCDKLVHFGKLKHK